MNPLDFPELATRILERRKFALVQHFSREVLESLRVDVSDGILDNVFDAMLIRLRMDLYGEKIATTDQVHEIKIPATWWEMFKRDRMPEWFRRRYPVRYSTTVVKFTADSWRMYPNADIPLTGERFGTSVKVVDYSKSIRWNPYTDPQ